MRTLGFTQRFFLLVTPLIATSSLVTSPTQAATLASSQGEFYLQNFSLDPEVTATTNNANISTIAKDSEVSATNNANIDFLLEPPEVINKSFSQAFGQNQNYLGLANADGKVLGNFFVDAGESFSVDFTAALDLETSIDKPAAENARASADISFLLFDTTDIANQGLLDDFFTQLLSDTTPNTKKTPLDFFSLSGNLNSFNTNDFITSQKSEYFTLSKQDTQLNFGGKAEFATALFTGSIKRSFANPTNLTFIQVRKSQVKVSVPEPSTSLALLFVCALVAIATKSKLKKITST
ncbi:PEP-CTERM sorting domain-containing protein [Plectonema radiosum NIES-515]|uniref:PEP-CTERM sorting domain-containing protein n=1 Tax=Plectonema radiosum NIES-515 TaxID=2986073 RepID=A0ABT3AZY7_9CYAN|nr:PEP-CTERM sorting domain-containing protein [Plectonema radiosum]MCV3214555.1 PEP-CTERM sorting domain-containing protein [Plectonema radiosum NIES-515]